SQIISSARWSNGCGRQRASRSSSPCISSSCGSRGSSRCASPSPRRPTTRSPVEAARPGPNSGRWHARDATGRLNDLPMPATGKSLRHAALLATACGAPLAAAEDLASHYTSAELKKCRKLGSTKVGGSDYGAVWACPGAAGYTVVVSEDDLRTTVSIG